jgi:hypothetical protein
MQFFVVNVFEAFFYYGCKKDMECIGYTLIMFAANVSNAFSKCYNRMKIPSKLYAMRFPAVSTAVSSLPRAGLEEFFHKRPRGMTVFYAPSASGKTCLLASLHPKNTLYWDCNTSSDFEQSFFSRRLGLDRHCELQLFYEFCSAIEYSTIVLDHFDNLIDHCFLYHMTRQLSVLVMCSRPETVESLLSDRMLQHDTVFVQYN